MTSMEPNTSSNLAERIVARSFAARDGDLLVGGQPVSELIHRHGTPLFVYDLDVVTRHWDRLRNTFPSAVQIHYSIKANPHRDLVRHLLGLGAGLEIASVGELDLAVNSGARPDQVLFAGPGKRDNELDRALRTGIREIHAESLHELRRLTSLAEKIPCRVPIALRVNPDSSVQGGAMRMGGKPSPFGVDEEAIDDAMDLVTRTPTMDWKGLHFYIGTQNLDAAILLRQYQHALNVAVRTAERWRSPVETLDFGGGLGVPYFDHDPDLDLDALRVGILEMIEQSRKTWSLSETRFVIEPGRFLVAESGVYLTRVLDIKRSRGKWFAVVDGGMHHHLAASGNLGQTIKRNFPIAVANKLNLPACEAVDVVGCLCTPLDTLARSASLPQLEPGDIVAVFQSGAYAFSASPQRFLSHPPASEVCVHSQRAATATIPDSATAHPAQPVPAESAP